MKLQRVELLDRKLFGRHVLLRCRWGAKPPEPGQFVMARDSSYGLDPFLSRPFFAHDYEDGILSLLVEIRGRATALLANANGGILMSGPRGQGFVLDGGGPVALVGGGVWISPFKLLSRRLAAAGTPHDIFLELSAQAPPEYEAWISNAFPAAIIVPTGESRHNSQEVLERAGDLSRYSTVYGSGPTAMLAAIRAASEGVVPAQLALREYMACATGACYGCAVPVRDRSCVRRPRRYARACVEGPVFLAGELAW